jgi:invasion protein IalB
MIRDIKGSGNRPETDGWRKTMKLNTLLVAAIALLGLTAGAAAQSATTLGNFKDWNAFVSNATDGKLCFIASQPTDSKYSKPVTGRDPAFFQITRIPTKNIQNEASSIVGYKFLATAEVTADVDGTKFKMFLDASHPDTAWAEPEQEAGLIEAMKKGTKLTLTGTSSRNTLVADSYSLSGISAALNAMLKECP